MTFAVRDAIPGNDYGRVCDVCARYRPGSKVRRVGDLVVCDKHPGYIPRKTLEAMPVISSGGPPPVENAKPWAARDTFEAAEAEWFKFITNSTIGDNWFILNNASWPCPVYSGNDVEAVAWEAIYLYELVNEAGRPVHWVTKARARFKECVEWLLRYQIGGPSVAIAQSASAGAAYGGIEFSQTVTGAGTFVLPHNAAAGIAFIRAYETFGDARYLSAAARMAEFIRTMQCGHLSTTGYSSADAGGTTARYNRAHSYLMTVSPGFYAIQDHRYYPDSLLAVEFLTKYQAIAGDVTIGYSAALAGAFSASRAALLSTCIAEALAFWTGGVADLTTGTTITGLSTTTPREFFNAYPSSKYGGSLTGDDSWDFQDATAATGTKVTSRRWALGIRALYNVGQTTLATTLFDWLMTFTSNSTYELPATTAGRIISGYDERTIWGGLKGTYNPKLALSSLLLVRDSASSYAATAKNATSLYDLATAGLLAPLYSARQQSTFADLKWQLGIERPRYREGAVGRDGDNLPLAWFGYCGLSYQPYTTSGLSRIASIGDAAMVGLVFRQAPKAFGGRGLV